MLSPSMLLILLDSVDKHLVLEGDLPESPFITLPLALNPGWSLTPFLANPALVDFPATDRSEAFCIPLVSQCNAVIFKCGSGDGLHQNCLLCWLKVQLSEPGSECQNFRKWDGSVVAFQKIPKHIKMWGLLTFLWKRGWGWEGSCWKDCKIFFLKPGQTLCEKRWLPIGVIGDTCFNLYCSLCGLFKM